ncbi:MAG: 50S ribosomal protein L18 [Pseudarcicella sp.]|nr:50S ribosomal protein L18 [Pseudarcicella sp.]MBP6409637.1 50S ribosomal protein L18 [Pseudarcicella sp.]
MANSKELRRDRIKKSIRAKISGTTAKPRLTVFRSNTAIYAQIVDDSIGRTLVAASSQAKDVKSANINSAKEVGLKIAKLALEAGISSVVFDRNGYLYHGKIKSLADSAREGGLKF